MLFSKNYVDYICYILCGLHMLYSLAANKKSWSRYSFTTITIGGDLPSVCLVYACVTHSIARLGLQVNMHRESMTFESG